MQSDNVPTIQELVDRIERLERLIAGYGINEQTASPQEYKPLKLHKSDPDEIYEPLTRSRSVAA